MHSVCCRCLLLLSVLVLGSHVRAESAAKVLIVSGPSSHPPGSHEVAAGARVMGHCLQRIENPSGIEAIVVYQWPDNDKLLDSVDTVVFIGDTFPPNRFSDSNAILQKLDEMTARGCGMVCVHYATGLLGQDVTEDGDHPLLRWIGGYFANRSCPHHTSIARIYPDATITPAQETHPILRGWKEFTLHDEPYINNYFGREENRLASGVTALATSMLPPESPKKETVAWCVQRPDGGRGFGIVMPHFYKNWSNEDLRRFILNGIVWTAKLEVPSSGVQSTLSDLSDFEPQSVEFRPRGK